MLRSAAASLLVLAWSSSAVAQDIQVLINDFTGRTTVPDLTDLGDPAISPINGTDCANGADITFDFTNVPIGKANLHYFRGSDCETTANRTSTTSTACVDLEVSTAINGNMEVVDIVAVSSLVDCTSTSSGTHTIYVLAIDDVTDDVTSADIATFDIAYDFSGPETPQTFTAAAGESVATLSWMGSTDNIETYEIYFVANGCTDGVVTSGIADPPTIDPVASIEGSNTSYSLVFPDTAAIGSQSAVAVRAIDQAGNPSNLSNVLCVDRIEVNTWWDTYCTGSPTPDACSSSGCALSPTRRPAPLVLLLLLAGSALVWARGRRR